MNTMSAFAGPGRTTYQAKIIKPDGYPLEASSVNFKFTILDPAGSCILYSETYSSVNMGSTGGLISFSLGSGVKTYPVSSPTFEDVFSNITPSLSCDTGGPVSYSPASSDIRKIVMQFHDGTGWQTLPAMNINAVPYAMYSNDSQKLNGLQASDFVQLSVVPACAASEAIRYNGTSFSCVVVGSSTSVTSGSVISALGYTPADGVSVTTVTATVDSVSSTVFSVSSTVTSLVNSVAASFAAVTSSQWVTSGTSVFFNGNVGIGTTTPVTKLEVSGGVRISMESASCAVGLAGTLRYNAGNVEFCNGTTWSAFGVSGAGLQSLNGSTSGTQSFANGVAGNAPAFATANGIHTLNIPLASAGSVTAGLISNVDYTSFSNKITSSAVSIAQVLGYTPASSTALGNYLAKASNLSDLASSATARSNLGLGSIALLNSIDLGSAEASGTLAIARLPSFNGDATIAAASNTIILSNSGVTAGTYTKLTVDGKGRVTSGTQLASSDVTTALGYTPANSATTVSSQWTTSGTTINYMTGDVGIGTASPGTKLEVAGQVKITGGTPGAGKVLTSDASGLATWADVSTPSNSVPIYQVRVTTTANITLSGNQTIDGVSVVAGDRVLVKNQSSPQNNGVYIVGAGAWTRSTDMDTWAKTIGYPVHVNEGSMWAGMNFISVTTIGGTLGTTAINWNSQGPFYLDSTAFGTTALNAITTGWWNTAFGASALASLTTGHGNTAIGRRTLAVNTTGGMNTAVGRSALSSSSTGGNNTALGADALGNSTTGSGNTATGNMSAANNTTGDANATYGYFSLLYNQAKSESTAIGSYSMQMADNTTVASISYNTAIGTYSLRGSGTSASNTGIKNTALGHSALFGMSSGSNNIGVGYNAGSAITTGSNNVVIGSNTGSTIATASNNIIIADGAGNERIRIDNAGNVGVGTTAPTAKLHLASGTTSVAPLRFTSGTLLTSPQSGTIEYDGANFYLTDGTDTRRAIAANTNPGTYDNVSNINSSGNMSLVPVGSVIVSSTTVSTNSQTGALIVKGGMGVAGDIYSSGTIVTSSNIQGVSVTATNGMISPYIYGSTSANGNLRLESTTNATKGYVLLASQGGNVGVGVASTNFPLQVSGTAHIDSLRIGFSAGTNFLMSYNSTSTLANGSWGWNLRDNFNNADKIFVERQSDGGDIIFGNGNVGIGTSSPSSALQVAGHVTVGSQGGTTDDNGDYYIKSNGQLYIQANQSGSSNVSYVHLVLAAGVSTSTNSAVITQTLGSERMRVDANGNVGVGTTAPSYLLDVQKSSGGSLAHFTASGDDRGAYIFGYDAGGYFSGNSSYDGSNWIAKSTTPSYIAMDPSGMEFFSNSGATIGASYTPASRLKILNNGNVGIGTTTPTDMLTVSSVSAGAIIRLDNSNASRSWRLLSNDASGTFGIRDETAATNRISINSLGDVGVGTTSPSGYTHGGTNKVVEIHNNGTGLHSQSHLVLSSNASMTGATAIGTLTWALPGSTNAPTKMFGWVGMTTGASSTMASPTTEMSFSTTAVGENYPAVKMYINERGNVGIGTTSPQGSLHVKSAAPQTNNPSEGIFLGKSANPGNLDYQLQLTTAGGGTPHIDISRGTNLDFDGRIASYADGAISISTIAGGQLITASGTNVGIGNATPSYRLDVAGSALIRGGAAHAIPDPTYGGTFFSFDGATNTAGLWSTNATTSQFAFYTKTGNTDSGTERLRITDTGNVGIGTSSPGYKLDVNGDIRITGTPYRNGGDSAWIVPSDARLKDVVSTYDRGLREIANIDTIIFSYKKDNPKQIDASVKYTGVLAQQVQQQIPEAVKVEKDGFLSLNTTPIFWAMVNAIKELYHKVMGHEAQLEKQARQIAAVQEENEKLKLQNAEKEKQLKDIRAYLCAKDPAAPICK